MKIRVKDYYDRAYHKDSIQDLLDLIIDQSYDLDNKCAVRTVLRRCIDDLCTIWADENVFPEVDCDE